MSTRTFAFGLVWLIALAGCQALPLGDGSPGAAVPTEDAFIPSVVCFRTWNDEQVGVGFNPPREMTGPVLKDDWPGPIESHPFRVDWYWPGDELPSITLVSVTAIHTLEEQAALSASLAPFLVFKNEAITLNSGQPGWVIATKSPGVPYDIMSVTVLLVWQDNYHSLRMYGNSRDGTYDYDYLLGVCRTLCAK